MDIIDKVKLSAKQKYDIARKLGATSDVARSLKSLGVEKFNMAIKPLKENHLISELNTLFEKMPKRTNERRREAYKILTSLGFDKERATQLKGSSLKVLQQSISQLKTEGRAPIVNKAKSNPRTKKADQLKYYKGDKLYKKRYNYRVIFDAVMYDGDEEEGEERTELSREKIIITISKDTEMSKQELLKVLDEEYFPYYVMKYKYEIAYSSIKIKAMQQTEEQLIRREAKNIPRPIVRPGKR